MSSTSTQLRSLFEAIGGEARLEEILNTFYARLSEDVLVGFFFAGHDVKKIAGHQRDLLLKAAGMTPSYSGKLPASAHLSLPPILSGHFDRRLRILEEVLATFGLTAVQIATWVGFEEQFRSVVVSSLLH